MTGGHKVLAHMLKIDLPSGIAKLGTSFFAAAIPPTVPFILPIAYFVFLVIWVVCHNRYWKQLLRSLSASSKFYIVTGSAEPDDLSMLQSSVDSNYTVRY